MSEEKGWDQLLALAFKAAFTSVTVLGIGMFVSGLPFARELAVFGGSVAAPDFIESILAVAVIAALWDFARASSPLFDRLLPWLRGAGRIASLCVAMMCVLYAYYALQPSVYPFIPDLEWAYQGLFLGVTLFILARLGLLAHAAGGELGEHAVALLKKISGLTPGSPGLDSDRKGP